MVGVIRDDLDDNVYMLVLLAFSFVANELGLKSNRRC